MSALDLSRLRSCPQRWDDMDPQPDGTRLCGGCGHLVRDFRRTRDAEVARVRAETPGPVCGIYTQRQLRRGGALPPAPSRWRSVAVAAGVSLAPAVAAQTEPSPRVPTEQTEAAPDSVRQPVRTVLAGRVTDADGVELLGANVIVRETSEGPLSEPIGVATDLDGRFRLDLSDLGLATGEAARVELGFAGFESLRIDHPAGVVRTDVELALSEDPMLYDLAFYAEAPPPCSLWGWLRRTLGL